MLDGGSGLGRRKPVRRASAERAAIVADTHQPGTTLAEVARRYRIVALQLSSWRTAAKRKADRDKRRGSVFAEVSVMTDAQPVPFDDIEVVCGAVLIRLPMDLSRNCVAPLIAYYALKANTHGNEINGRI